MHLHIYDVDEVHASRRRPDVERLFVPGEIETEIARDYNVNGINLAGPTFEDTLAIAERLGVDASKLAT